VKDLFIKEGLWDEAYDGAQKEWFRKTLEMTRERFHTLKDFATLGRAWFADDFSVDEAALAKNVLKHPELKEWLPELADRFAALPELGHDETERLCREFAEELGVKVGVLVNAARTVITGQVKGPSMFEVFAQMGRERVVKRLREAGKYFH